MNLSHNKTEPDYGSSPTAADESWMRRALALAAQGLGRTSPNPAVGAVLIKDGISLATGWHQHAGGPHAEIEALRALPKPVDARGATIYVTLEPCSTQGKTPPCTQAIIEAGCARVVYGATDPDPRHRGRAKSILNSAGIEVTSGVLAAECDELNCAWNHWIQTKLPWVILKAGQSLDGRITPPPPDRNVTSDEARKDAMRLRAQCDAILVGGETLRTDLPHLNVRGIEGAPQPRRIIWSRNPEQLPAGAPPFRDENADRTLVVSSPSFAELCRDLGAQGIVRLLVEGGGRVHGAAVDSGLVNEIVFYTAPVIFGGGVPTTRGVGAADVDGGLHLHIKEATRIGPDLKIRAVVDLEKSMRCQ